MSKAMKDSGIPWIGEIPEGWTNVYLKHYFAFEKGKNAALYTQEYIGENEGIFPVYSGQTENEGVMGRINTYDYDEPECLFTTTVGAKVMTPRVLQGKFSLSQNCLIMKNIKTTSVHFFYYGLSALFDYEKSLIPSHMQPSLRIEDLKKYKLFIPPLAEQQRIAEFLDRKCAEVDEMIALQEQIIEELKAYKQSVITEAVTKGLNPDVPMKDSGIEWIGQIPEHWEVSKVKWECAIMDYLREPISAENRKNELGLYDYYGASGVIDKIDDYNVDDKVLLIGEDGANLVMRNLPLVYKAEGKFWVNNHAHILKPLANNCYSYMAYMLEAGDYTHYITGSAQPKLSQDNIKNFIIPMPRDYTEQQTIADYLGEKCADIDSLIQTKQSKIDSLKEYKKSIIYEYVTGKKEVK